MNKISNWLKNEFSHRLFKNNLLSQGFNKGLQINQFKCKSKNIYFNSLCVVYIMQHVEIMQLVLQHDFANTFPKLKKTNQF